MSPSDFLFMWFKQNFTCQSLKRAWCPDTNMSVNYAKGPFYWYGWLESHHQVITSIINCGVKLCIHFQNSAVRYLVIEKSFLPTLYLARDYLFMLKIKLIHVKERAFGGWFIHKLLIKSCSVRNPIQCVDSVYWYSHQMKKISGLLEIFDFQLVTSFHLINHTIPSSVLSNHTGKYFSSSSFPLNGFVFYTAAFKITIHT